MHSSLSAEKISALQTYSRKVEMTVIDSLESTNSYLLTQANMGMTSDHICVADSQTKGRGQRGNQWRSPPKLNIYCSILWYFNTAETALTGLSLLVGVAVIKTLQHFNLPSLGLKWPNDVWQANKKIAGILLEHAKLANSVVIGIGLNVNAPEHGDSIDSIWTCMQHAASRSFDRNEVAAVLLDNVLMLLTTFSPSRLPALLSEWAQWDVLYHKKIDFSLADRQYRGLASGIDQHGRLIIYIDGKKQFFSSGNIRSIHTG